MQMWPRSRAQTLAGVSSNATCPHTIKLPRASRRCNSWLVPTSKLWFWVVRPSLNLVTVWTPDRGAPFLFFSLDLVDLCSVEPFCLFGLLCNGAGEPSLLIISCCTSCSGRELALTTNPTETFFFLRFLVWSYNSCSCSSFCQPLNKQ